jgi:hypothetical protein
MQCGQQRAKELQISMPSAAATTKPRDGGGEDLIAFQLPGEVTAQGKNGARILALQGVTDGVLTERAKAMAQRALATFGLDAMQGTKLASAAQEDGIEDLLGRVRRIATAVG